jgi:hypothetical protein
VNRAFSRSCTAANASSSAEVTFFVPLGLRHRFRYEVFTRFKDGSHRSDYVMRVPIILTSRADKTLARLGSCAIALLLARHKTGERS